MPTMLNLSCRDDDTWSNSYCKANLDMFCESYPDGKYLKKITLLILKCIEIKNIMLLV